jgi:hypothetical protein
LAIQTPYYRDFLFFKIFSIFLDLGYQDFVVKKNKLSKDFNKIKIKINIDFNTVFLQFVPPL